MTERDNCIEWLKTLGLNEVKFDKNNQIISVTRQSHCDLSYRDIELMIRAWQASASREGYKLVPVEPTNDIKESMYDAAIRCEDMDGMYKAMIGAVD